MQEIDIIKNLDGVFGRLLKEGIEDEINLFFGWDSLRDDILNFIVNEDAWNFGGPIVKQINTIFSFIGYSIL